MRTINLLPKPRQEELRYDAVLHGLWLLMILSLVSFGLVFLAQFGTKFYLELQAQEIKSEVVALQKQVGEQQNSDVKAKVVAINNLIEDFKSLSDSSPKWSNVIKAFAPLPPPGVKINTFQIQPVDNSIVITGLAPTRDLVIQLYQNILNDKTDFSGIDYPWENIAKPTDINFHFNFYINKSLLH